MSNARVCQLSAGKLGCQRLPQSVDDQRSEDRNRRSKVSRQNSEVTSENSEATFLPRNKERFRLFDHAAQQSANLCTFSGQGIVLFRRDISALLGKVQRSISLAVLTITVGQLTHKMGGVTPLCPCFSKVQADRSRRAPYLTRQSVFFFFWKVPCDLENLHRKFVCELVNIQLLG
jgi:hypothetical protein